MDNIIIITPFSNNPNNKESKLQHIMSTDENYTIKGNEVKITLVLFSSLCTLSTHLLSLIKHSPITSSMNRVKISLIIFFKILKFMHGHIICYWNGIRGKNFQILKK